MTLPVQEERPTNKMASEERLSTQIYQSPGDVDSLRGEWEALLAEFPQATPFCTLEWLLSWWRAFGGNDRLQILAFRDDSACLRGLAPLASSPIPVFGGELRRLRLVGDGSHDSDNLDLPATPGYEKASCQALLNWMERQSGEWDICELRTLPEMSPVGNQLLEELRTRRWKVLTSLRPQSLVELPETWEDYLARLSSKERGKVGLRARRLEKKYRTEIYRCAVESELDTALQALYELHAKHWRSRGLPGTLQVPARRQFYRELAGSLLARQRLEFWLLRADGKVVATQFGLRHGNQVFSLQEGYDPDYSADSVGYVLRSQALKKLIAEGIRKYDFLGGVDDSKLRWGAQIRHYLNMEFARPGTRGSLYLSLKRKGEETKAWLRKRLPGPLRLKLKQAGERILD